METKRGARIQLPHGVKVSKRQSGDFEWSAAWPDITSLDGLRASVGDMKVTKDYEGETISVTHPDFHVTISAQGVSLVVSAGSYTEESAASGEIATT